MKRPEMLWTNFRPMEDFISQLIKFSFFEIILIYCFYVLRFTITNGVVFCQEVQKYNFLCIYGELYNEVFSSLLSFLAQHTGSAAPVISTEA
jgi:hypothetical protein